MPDATTADGSARLILIGRGSDRGSVGVGRLGMPCPVCNHADEDNLPEMPDGFVPDWMAEGAAHVNQGIGSKSCSP